MNAPARHWSSVGESTLVWGMNVLMAVYRLFGRLPFRLCVYPVVMYYYLTRPVARQASQGYLCRLQQATGALQTSPTWRHSVRHFARFAESLLDKMLAMSGRYPFDQVRSEGRELMVNQLATSTGGVIITCHMGCLELCRVLAKEHRGLRINILVHTRYAQQITAVLQRMNPGVAMQLIEIESMSSATATVLSDRVERGEFVAIAGDRVPVRGSHVVHVPFLGQPAPFPSGPYVLASVLQCPLFFLGCVHDGQNYVLSFARLAERVDLPRRHRQAALQTYAAAYVVQLERLVRRSPYDWFNFYAFWHQGVTV